MKTRQSLVSNSSSSSFILSTYEELINKDIMKAIADNAFLITLMEFWNWDDAVEKAKKEFGIENVDLDNEDRHEIILEIKDLDTVIKALDFADKECGLVCVWTGGTSSEVEPQVFLQDALLSQEVDYLTRGDDMLDIRHSDSRKIIYQNDYTKDDPVIVTLRKHFGDEGI